MSCFDFFVRKEHKFIRNVLDKDDTKKSHALKSLSAYYEIFTKFLKVFILLGDSIKRLTNFDEMLEEDLRDFCLNNCGEFDDLKKTARDIEKFQTKNSVTKFKIVTPQTISFVYTHMKNFPNGLYKLCIN